MTRTQIIRQLEGERSAARKAAVVNGNESVKRQFLAAEKACEKAIEAVNQLTSLE